MANRTGIGQNNKTLGAGTKSDIVVAAGPSTSAAKEAAVARSCKGICVGAPSASATSTVDTAPVLTSAAVSAALAAIYSAATPTTSSGTWRAVLEISATGATSCSAEIVASVAPADGAGSISAV